VGGAPEGGVRIVTREALAPLLILHFVNLISPPKRPPTTGVRRGPPAFNYPQPVCFNSKPRTMSVSRASPRQITMVPGGGSLARAR